RRRAVRPRAGHHVRRRAAFPALLARHAAAVHGRGVVRAKLPARLIWHVHWISGSRWWIRRRGSLASRGRVQTLHGSAMTGSMLPRRTKRLIESTDERNAVAGWRGISF